MSTLRDRVEALLSSAMAFAKWHSEHAAYGGAAREFHERAETHIGCASPELARDLLAEVERLRSELAAVRATARSAAETIALIAAAEGVHPAIGIVAADLRARIGGGS